MEKVPQKETVLPRHPSFWRSPLILILAAMALLIALSLLVGRSDRLRLSPEDEAQLLALARRQLEATVVGTGEITVSPESLGSELLQPRAAFVTIYVRGEMRGCIIDRFEPHEPLYRNVLRNTILAAQADDRFASIAEAELDETVIEVSVIDRLRQAEFSSPEELLRLLTPFEDGVILRLGTDIATFLPYVWQTYSDPEEFLSELCIKAGWEADRWRMRPYPTVEIYSVYVFGESSSSPPAATPIDNRLHANYPRSTSREGDPHRATSDQAPAREAVHQYGRLGGLGVPCRFLFCRVALGGLASDVIGSLGATAQGALGFG